MELNEELYKKIALTSIETPIPLFKLAEGKGVPKAIYFRWLNKGEKDIIHGVDSLHAKFFKSIKAKELSWILNLVECVRSEHDKSAQWILERICPDVFSDTRGLVEQYAKYVDMIETSAATKMLPEDTALANAHRNVDKFKGTTNETT